MSSRDPALSELGGSLALLSYSCDNTVMADDADLRAFVHERFRRSDEKLDKVIEGLAEMRQMVAGIVQISASHDQHMLAMEVRLGKIENRLDLHDPAIPG